MNIYQPKEYNCAKCEDSGAIFGSYSDEFSGQELEYMQECPCQEVKRIEYLRTLSYPSIENVPILFKEADLQNLAPLDSKHPKQRKVVETIRANPFESYMFVGNSGVGKTWMTWALWKNARASGRIAISMTAAELAKELQNLETRNSVRTCISPDALAQSDILYTLVIDDVDKMKITDFSIGKLFELIKNAGDYGHQLIITTQKSEIGLRDKLSEKDEVWGDAISRRLSETTSVVEMWK